MLPSLLWKLRCSCCEVGRVQELSSASYHVQNAPHPTEQSIPKYQLGIRWEIQLRVWATQFMSFTDNKLYFNWPLEVRSSLEIETDSARNSCLLLWTAGEAITGENLAMPLFQTIMSSNSLLSACLAPHWFVLLSALVRAASHCSEQWWQHWLITVQSG